MCSGSRILGGYALEGGMPIGKYVVYHFLTLDVSLIFFQYEFKGIELLEGHAVT